MSRNQILVNQILVDQTAILQDRSETDATVHVCQRWLDLHQTVVQNVWSTLTVPLSLPVSTESVKIPVQDSVGSMPTAESGITFQSVSAIKDMSETPSPAATDQPQHHQDQWILADLHLVESMQSVERGMEQPRVLVSQDSLEIPTLSASLSAQSTLSAPLTRPVSDRSVWTHVLESVELTPPAPSTITARTAGVSLATQGTPSLPATESQHRGPSLTELSPAIRLLVDQMQSAVRETELQPVSVSQTTLETPTLPVDQNVWWILTVPRTKHVSKCTA